MPCKKLLGTGNREFLIYLIYSNKSVCLQLIKQSSQVMSKVRNSRSEVFCKRDVLHKIHWKTTVTELLF